MNDEYPVLPSLLSQRLLEAKISTLSPVEPMSIGASDMLSVAFEKLRSNSHGSVLILNAENQLRGIFTDQDAVRRVALKGLDLEKTAIHEVMTAAPHSLRGRASIARAIYSMAKGGFRHLPVMATGDVPVGVLSVRDTVRYIFKLIEKKQDGSLPGKFLNAEALTQFLNSSIETMNLLPAIIVKESDSFQTAVETMSDQRVGALLVASSSGRLKGIFTERDFIMKVSLLKDWQSRPISEGMTPEPTFVRAGSTLKHCVQIMSKGGYRHIPVIDRDDHPLHILSVRDFISAFGDSVVRDLENQKNEE